MTEAQIKNLGWHLLYAFIGAAAATGLQFAAMLAGDGALTWRPVAATFALTFFSSVATAIGTSRQPRAGSEQLAIEVNALKAAGVDKADMTVVRSEDAPLDPDHLTPSQALRVADILEARMRNTPATR